MTDDWQTLEHLSHSLAQRWDDLWYWIDPERGDAEFRAYRVAHAYDPVICSIVEPMIRDVVMFVRAAARVANRVLDET